MIKVYTKLIGKLACWEAQATELQEAIKQVRDELGVKHKGVILALVPREPQSIIAA